MVDHELQAVDDVEDGRVALVVGGLDRDQVGVRGDADVPAVERVAVRARGAVAGDQAGDVGAVAEGVGGGRGAGVDDRGRDHRASVASVRESRKSGRLPWMPVSMTATPTPLPV